ncbi:WXG100 family type VII secretion target [Dietzia cinnamea]|uniref:WXG100 family type VII secretion target n=1 Tax=Dietzia cinnamea TaxID=321318 RepID=UPI0035CD0C9A
MSYAVGELRRWNPGALLAAGETVSKRVSAADGARRVLEDGAGLLDEGWDGRSADAVLDAVENEKRHVAALAMGLEDLEDALRRAAEAIRSALATLQGRLADAEADGLQIVGDSLTLVDGRGETPQAILDLHAEAIRGAIETVRSLDEHYAREIDEIAAALHHAIPPAVDRSPIPGPDDPWPGRGVDAMTGAMSEALPKRADELDPATRGRHVRNPAPDDFARPAATGLRLLGKVAGPLGGGLTVYDGLKAHAEGKTSTAEPVAETTGALGGGMLGGAAAGAVAGTMFGPLGTFIGAGIGAAVGTYLGQKTGDLVHEKFSDDHANR